MTTPTLPEILQRLRDEKWNVEQGAWDGCDGRTNYIKSGTTRIAALEHLPYAQNLVDLHNAPLLAVCDALKEAVAELENYHRVPFAKDVIESITQKLTAALKL